MLVLHQQVTYYQPQLFDHLPKLYYFTLIYNNKKLFNCLFITYQILKQKIICNM
jgi:hypothetical protein